MQTIAKPKGMVIMIAVGRGEKSAPCGHPSHKKGKGVNMIKIPLEALASQSEEGEAVQPQVGDTVVLESVEGTVSSIEGEAAHIELQSVNGAPIDYAEQKEEGEPSEGEEELLRAMAESEDEKAMR